RVRDHEAARLVEPPERLALRVHPGRRRSDPHRAHGCTTNVPFMPCLECESTWQKNSYSPGWVGVNFTVLPPQNMPTFALTSMPASLSQQVRLCGTKNEPFLTLSSTRWPAFKTTRLGSNQYVCALIVTFCTLSAITAVTSFTGLFSPDEQPASSVAANTTVASGATGRDGSSRRMEPPFLI